MAPRVTLTTDFGTRDPYVAAMKGVIASICPEAIVIDLTHEIAPQNVLEGALFLSGAIPYFPEGTVHVAVVDPGVGSARRAVAVRAGGQVFVGPDNGLFTLLLSQYSSQEAYAIADPRFMRENVSATFHGRDVFAPAAAHVARGVSLSELGPPAGELETLSLPEPSRTDGGIRGSVIHADRFGNLITNVPRAMIPASGVDGARVRAGNSDRLPLFRTYSDVASGKPLALFGSMDLLEIAVNGGSAAQALGLGPGAPVEVTFET